MKSTNYFLPLIFCIFLVVACKKDTQKPISPQQQNHGLESGVQSFSVNGQLVDAIIDTVHNIIFVTVANSSDEKNLTINFTLANQVTAKINNQPAVNGSTLDISNPIDFTVTSNDGTRFTTFKLTAQTELGYFGLPGTITAQNSLTKDYNFYFDQFDGSTYQLINCGPASTTMAIKWADSTFQKKPVDARSMYLPQGGWWNTGQVQAYLGYDGIDNVVDTLANFDEQIKNAIDNNDAVILNPDMNYIPYNSVPSQHTGKFYLTTPGWGHYILVKGYKVVRGSLYLEVYDPYSDNSYYSSNIDRTQLKGQDRYYASDDVRLSTTNWWSYAIIIAPKGKKVTESIKLKINSTNKPVPISYGR